ncbi:hypothetical protein B296_00014523 [Ensete ventricosum]|uniref:Uncharacterized protein n=1 Tax=Ensete ventricosum TaxID=4639 RepID=A0A427AXK4_ENSVE|nr:hypothetical protein B296_00014523 [Ensete ventricosum]
MTGRGSAEASSHCLGCRPANTRWIEAFGRGGGRCSRPPACKVQMKQSCALAAGAEGLRYTDSSGLGEEKHKCSLMGGAELMRERSMAFMIARPIFPLVSFCSVLINVAGLDRFQRRRGKKLGRRDKTSSGSPTGPSSNKSSAELPGKPFKWGKRDPCDG